MKELLKSLDPLKIQNSTSNELKNLNNKLYNYFNLYSLEQTFGNSSKDVLYKIWNHLFKSSSHSDEELRLSTQRTTGIILLKSIPFYSENIINFFKEFKSQSNNSYSSLFIISIFSWFTHYFDRFFIEELLFEDDLYQFFLINDSIILENLSIIIDNLENIPFLWYKNLFNQFLQKLNGITNKSLFNIILSLIKKDQQLFQILLDYSSNNMLYQNTIVLISYIINSNLFLFDNYNLMEYAKLSIDILGNKSSNDLIDASFTILSLKSKFYKLSLEINSNLDIIIKIFDENNSFSSSFNISDYSNHHLLFLLPLPLEKLKDNIELNTIFNLSSKLTSISNLANLTQDINEINEIFQIYYNYFVNNKKNNKIDEISPYLRSLINCFDIFFNKIDKIKIINLIQEIIFSNKKSWFEIKEVFFFIRKIGLPKLITLINKEFIDIIINEALENFYSLNFELYNESKLLLIDSAEIYGSEILCSILFQKSDVFNSMKFERLLIILDLIMNPIIDYDFYYILPIIISVFELLDYHQNYDVLTAAFKFLSNFDLSIISNNSIGNLNIIPIIISSSINYLSGTYNKNKLSQEQIEKFTNYFSKRIENKKFEILSDNIENIYSLFSSIKYSLIVLNSVDPSIERIPLLQYITNHVLCLFPLETSNILIRYWPLMNKNEKTLTLNTILPYLSFKPNLNVSSLWLKIILDPSNELFLSQFPNFYLVFNNLIHLCIENYERYESKTILNFIEYSLSNELLKEKLLNSISNLSNERQQEFYKLIMINNPNICKQITNNPPEVPQIFSSNFFMKSVLGMVNFSNNLVFSINDQVQKRINKKSSIEIREQILEQLNSNLISTNISSKYILTQLIYNLYSYSIKEITELINYYLSSFNIYGLEIVLTYFISKFPVKKLLDFNFPLIIIPHLLYLLHIKKVKNKNLTEFTVKFVNNSNDSKILLASYCSEPIEHCNKLKDKQNLEIKDIFDLCKVITLSSNSKWHSNFPFSFDQILSIIEKSISFSEINFENNYTESISWFYGSLLLNILFVHYSNNIEQITYDQIISKINETSKGQKSKLILFNDILTLLLLKFSEKVKEQFILNSLFTQLQSSSNINSISYFRLSLVNYKLKLNFDIQFNNLLNLKIYSTLPSEISDGLLLYNELLKSNDLYKNLIKLPFIEILNIINNNFGIPSIIKSFTLILNTIIQNESCNIYIPSLFDFFINLKKLQDLPDINEFGLLIPNLFSSLNVQIKYKDLLLHKISKFLRTPSNWILFQIYINSFKYYISTFTDVKQQNNLLDENLPIFYQQLNSLDLPQADLMYYEILIFISNIIGVEDTIKKVLYSIYPHVPRFLPFFIAFNRFVEINQLRRTSESQKIMRKIIKSSMSQEICRVHFNSILFLFKSENLRKYCINLAQFNKDTKESDAYIAQIKGKINKNRNYK